MKPDRRFGQALRTVLLRRDLRHPHLSVPTFAAAFADARVPS